VFYYCLGSGTVRTRFAPRKQKQNKGVTEGGGIFLRCTDQPRLLLLNIRQQWLYGC
jgi:hypothetical protein